MSRTISTTRPPPGPNGEEYPPDIDGNIVDANESLAQRIRCAFYFRLGEYFLDTTKGLDYDLLLGRIITPAQAAQVMVDAVRQEGGDEIVDVNDVEYRLDAAKRRFVFSCKVQTIHGTIPVDTEI